MPPAGAACGRSPGLWSAVWANREYRGLWVGYAVTLAGDQLARVALSLLVFADTGSAAASGAAYAVTLLPALIGGPLLSGLAGRYPRRTVMVGCDLAAPALTATMAIPALPLIRSSSATTDPGAWAASHPQVSSNVAVWRDPGRVGPPPVLGRDGCRGRRGAGGDRAAAGGADGRRVRPGGRRAGAGHDQLRHVHRLGQRQGADRGAGAREAEAERPAAGRVGDGGQPGRRGAAGRARVCGQPAGCGGVRRRHRGVGGPLPSAGGRRPGADRGLRRRAELRGEPSPTSPRSGCASSAHCPPATTHSCWPSRPAAAASTPSATRD